MPGPKKQPPSAVIKSALQFMAKGSSATEAAALAGVPKSTLLNFLARHPEYREGLNLKPGRRFKPDSAAGRAMVFVEAGWSHGEAARMVGTSQPNVTKAWMRRCLQEIESDAALHRCAACGELVRLEPCLQGLPQASGTCACGAETTFLMECWL